MGTSWLGQVVRSKRSSCWNASYRRCPESTRTSQPTSSIRAQWAARRHLDTAGRAITDRTPPVRAARWCRGPCAQLRVLSHARNSAPSWYSYDWARHRCGLGPARPAEFRREPRNPRHSAACRPTPDHRAGSGVEAARLCPRVFRNATWAVKAPRVGVARNGCARWRRAVEPSRRRAATGDARDNSDLPRRHASQRAARDCDDRAGTGRADTGRRAAGAQHDQGHLGRIQPGHRAAGVRGRVGAEWGFQQMKYCKSISPPRSGGSSSAPYPKVRKFCSDHDEAAIERPISMASVLKSVTG